MQPQIPIRQASTSPSTSSTDVKSLKDKLLTAYKGTIRQDREDTKRFVCRACKSKKKTNASGKWYNCQGHLDTKSHKQAIIDFNPEEGSPSEEPHEDELIEEIANVKPKHQETLLSQEDLLIEYESRPEQVVDENIELRISYMQFLLENRLPFSLIKNLYSFVSDLAEHYSLQSLQTFRASRQTIVRLTKSVCNDLKIHIFNQLKRTPFSLSLDASSDSFGSTYLAICAKYMDPTNPDHIVNKLVSVLPLTTSSTGEVLFNKVMSDVLNDENLQRNFMGISSDEGGNMMGDEKGICSRLRVQFPHIVVVPDFSHVYNTIFTKGLKAVPDRITKMIKGICSHFSKSTQRRACLDEIQLENNMPRLTVLRFTEIRWLSMRDALKRILDIWASLSLYFQQYGTKKERLYLSKKNEAYLRVIYVLIDQINSYNVFFQQENIYFNEIIDKIQESFMLFYSMIAKQTETDLDFNSTFNLPFEVLKDCDIVAGVYRNFQTDIESRRLNYSEKYIVQYDSIKKLFTEINGRDKAEIIETSVRFILLVLKYMKKKLPFSNATWDNIQVIFLAEFDKVKWMNLKDKFSNILSTPDLKESFVNELSRLEYNFKKIQYQIMMTKPSPLALWNSLQKDYPTLYLLSKALLVLPYSSVNVERIFSSLKQIHTPSRNRLTLENVEACLLAYQHYRENRIPITFESAKMDIVQDSVDDPDNVIEDETEKEDYFGISQTGKKLLKKKAATNLSRSHKKLKF